MIDYDKILNKRVVEMRPSGIRKFFDIAEQMTDVISLGVGEPDFPTPWHIRREGIRSLENGRTRYTSNHGLLTMREEISSYFFRKYGVKYAPEDEILVTVGGSEAIDGAIRALVTCADEVIIPQPSYVCYEPITQLAGGIPVIVETKAENEFKLTADELKAAITDKTKLLILPYPCNPTGAVMRRNDLEAIAEVLKDTDIIVLSDEIYSELTFGDERHVSFASIGGMKERTITVNGFSKTYSMTGWRMGYVCGPTEIINQITKIHQYAIMCAPTTSQYAAIEALRNGDADIAKMIEEYDMRRRVIVDGFNKLGLGCREPHGAFYAFASVKNSGMESDEFAEKLLRAEHVAVVPGEAFGPGGQGFIRCCYATSADELRESIVRIKRFLQR